MVGNISSLILVLISLWSWIFTKYGMAFQPPPLNISLTQTLPPNVRMADSAPSPSQDISTENRRIPASLLQKMRPLPQSPCISTLSITGWNKPLIDTWGPDRWRMFPTLTENEQGRQQFWKSLLDVAMNSKAYYEPNQEFIEKAHTLQMKLKYKTKKEKVEILQKDFHLLSAQSNCINEAEAIEAAHSEKSDVWKQKDIPIPPLFSNFDHPDANAWAILNQGGAQACHELPSPQTKLEAWRQQPNLKKFYTSEFDSKLSTEPISERDIDAYIPENAYCVLVMRDGIVDYKLSKNLDQITSNAQGFVGSYFHIPDPTEKNFIFQQLFWIPEYTNYRKKNTQPFHRAQIGKMSRKYDNDFPIFDYRKFDFGMAKFTALNQAGLHDAAVIIINENVILEKPIVVLQLATNKEAIDPSSKKSNPLTNTRLVVHIHSNSSASIQQSLISLNKHDSGMVNSATRLYLESKSNLKHSYFQDLGMNFWHWENLSVQNSDNANCETTTAQIGAQSSRINEQVETAENCQESCIGLGLASDRQHLSKYQMFHHDHPNATTEQFHKYLIADKATGVWRGRIRIDREGVHAKVDSLCRAILLNQGTECIAIPTLEIVPNDVERATHGAAISDLEKNPIFYLMTRGIEETQARYLMMKAFVTEVTNKFSCEKSKYRVLEKLKSMVPQTKNDIASDASIRSSNVIS